MKKLGLIMTFLIMAILTLSICSFVFAENIDVGEITSISYEQEKPYEIVERTNGYTTTNYVWDDEKQEEVPVEAYYYSYDIFQPGDKLVIHKADDTEVKYVFRNESERGFYSDDGDFIEESNFSFSSNQDGIGWQIESDNFVTINYNGFETEAKVIIKENNIKTIEYKKAKDYEYIEGTNGWENESNIYDENDNLIETKKVYMYNYDMEAGDVLKLNYKDGTSKEFTYKNEENYEKWGFYANDGEFIKRDDVRTNDNQNNNPWTVGDSNEYTVEYWGIKTNVKVKIIENPVETIDFTPKKTYEYIENVDGSFEKGYDDEEFFNYSFYSFYEGDKLTVNYKDKRTVVYTYKYTNEGSYFTDENGNKLYDYCNIDTKQYEKHWTVGSNNYVTVTYLNHKKQVPVTIKENIVKTIEFNPVKPCELYENVDGNWIERFDENDNVVDRYFYYYENYSNFFAGDKLTVNYKDGSKQIFTYSTEKDKFIGDNGDIIKNMDIFVSANQHDIHWTINKKNYYEINYMGSSIEVPVIIKENPVKSIEYNDTQNYEFIEYSNGNWSYDSIWNGSEYEKISYYTYYSYTKKGDILKVNYKDGTSKNFILNNDLYEYVSDSGEKINRNEIEFLARQDSYNQWTAGNSYEIKIKYMGSEITKNVKITENPVKSIVYSSKDNFEYKEKTHGYMASSTWYENGEEQTIKYYRYDLHCENGHSMTVTYKDGTSKEFEYKDGTFVSKDGDTVNINDIYFKYDQNEKKQWTLGNSYDISVVYMGRESKHKVKIVENPIKSITFTPKEKYEYVEETGGNWTTRYDWDSETQNDDKVEFYQYWTPGFKKGDILEVNNGGKTIKYVFDYDYEKNKERAFYDENGKIITGEVYMDTNQYEAPWTIGNKNYIIISYMGVTTSVPVTVKENEVKSIEFKPSVPYTFIEKVYGFESTDNNNKKYFYYYLPHLREGDMLTVTKKDNTKTSYKYYVDENKYGFYSDKGEKINANYVTIDSAQNLQPWTVGNNNIMKVMYMGRTAEIKVTVKKNDIKKIDYVPAKEYVIEENTNGELKDVYIYDENDNEIEEKRYIYDFGLRDGDIIKITRTNGNVDSYKYKHYDDYTKSGFYDENNKLEISEFDVYAYSEQEYNGKWTVGGNNYFTVVYIGHGGFNIKVPVKIVAKTACKHERTEIKNKKAATINEEGYTGDTVCTICKQVIKKGEKIAKLQNTTTKEDEVKEPIKIESLNISLEKTSYTYDGKNKEPSVVVKNGNTTLKKDTDYKVSYKNNKNVGTATVTITGTNNDKETNQYTGKIEKTFKITAKKISKAKVTGIKDKEYTGKAIKQSITIKDGKTKLKDKTDYTIKYSSNKKVGTATITITGKGNYTGTVKKTFKINPKGVKISKVNSKSKGFKLTWKKNTTQTTGYEIQYSTNKNFKNSNKTVTVSKNKTTSKTVSKLKGKKKYYIRIRTYKKVGNKKYYSSWSTSKNVTTKK